MSTYMFQKCNMTMAAYGMPTPNGPNLNYKFFYGPCGEFYFTQVMVDFLGVLLHLWCENVS